MLPARKAMLFSITFLIFCLGQAQAQVRISSDEAEKLLIEKPEPVYPAIAKAMRAEGLVKVEATVSEQGLVTSAKAISGHPLLQPSALSAVKKRRYKAHMVGDKPVPFVTEVYVRFPPGALTGAQQQEYDRQEQLAREYFKEDDRCRALVRGQKWREAEESCQVIVRIADQLSDDRALERMGAYQLFGHVLRGQRRYQEALGYYQRALDVVGSRLTEKNAELGRLYGDMAITHHHLRNLDKARELYGKAEKILQLAYASIGGPDADEETDTIRQSYLRSLKQLLEFHLRAAEDAGAASEVEEIKRLLKSLP